MIKTTEILVANSTALILLGMLWIQLGNKKHHRLFDERVYLLMLKIAFVQCILDTTLFLADGLLLPGVRFFEVVGNLVYFSFNILFAFLWPLYAIYKMGGSIATVRTHGVILSIPAYILLLLIISSPITKFAFYINEKNEYVRGVGLGICYVLPFVYMFYGWFYAYKNRKNEGKYMIFPVNMFLFPVILATILQLMNYGISLSCLGISVGMVSLYISLQSESAYIDRLSGVYNRRYLDEYLNGVKDDGVQGDTITGIMIDMDDFKGINDTYGHREGDEAITIMGNLLRKEVGKEGFVTRYGGDEFIIITSVGDEKISELVERLKNVVSTQNENGKKPYQLMFSYGVAYFKFEEESSDAFMHRMDDEMYHMKEVHKNK